jgi:hypothetical protein
MDKKHADKFFALDDKIKTEMSEKGSEGFVKNHF